MGDSSTRILVLATLSVFWLVQISPAAADLLHCFEETEASECCPEEFEGPPLATTGTLSSASDCDCCLAIDALPDATGNTGPHSALTDDHTAQCFIGQIGTDRSAAATEIRSKAPTQQLLGSLRTVRLLL